MLGIGFSTNKKIRRDGVRGEKEMLQGRGGVTELKRRQLVTSKLSPLK